MLRLSAHRRDAVAARLHRLSAVLTQFVIQRRGPGYDATPEVTWESVAALDARDPASAIQHYARHREWLGMTFDHNVVRVPGPGTFRAVVADDSPAARSIVIQRQDPIEGDARHLTWSDINTVRAADTASAIRAYLDWMGWGLVPVFGDVANVVGLGSFRAVPAEMADDVRVTPAPER